MAETDQNPPKKDAIIPAAIQFFALLEWSFLFMVPFPAF
jgi:hypothetical protein